MAEWYVVRFNGNSRRFEEYNVLSDHILVEIKKRTKKLDRKKDFAEEVKHICMYHFWSKCEWEIVLKEWGSPTRELKETKIDVYDQLCLNWDRFIDYLWGVLRE